MKNSVIYKMARRGYHLLRYIFYPFGYLRNYVFFPIKAFFRSKCIKPFYNGYEGLRDLKNCHEGKRGFVIATGPSLRWEDLDKLKDDVTIGINTLYKGYSKSDFRPSYYMILDRDVLIDLDKSNIGMEDLATNALFLNDMIKRRGKKIIPTPINYLNHWFNYGNPKFNYEKNLKFSVNLLWGLYDKYTTTICAIEAAIYMGCKEIYLLGVDCNFMGKKLHFIDTEYDSADWAPNKNEQAAILQQKANILGYEFVKRKTEKMNVKIYNATRGGSLEVFEKVSFDEIPF